MANYRSTYNIHKDYVEIGAGVLGYQYIINIYLRFILLYLRTTFYTSANPLLSKNYCDEGRLSATVAILFLTYNMQ